MEMKNMIVGQSGGPTAAINSSLYGVVSEGLRQKEFIGRVYGMVNGIEGFLGGYILDFETRFPAASGRAQTTPGAYLGIRRYKLPEDFVRPGLS